MLGLILGTILILCKHPIIGGILAIASLCETQEW